MDPEFKHFTVRATLFTLLFMVFFAVGNLYYHYRITREESFFMLFKSFQNTAIQPKVVILGDSHAAFGIDNDLLTDQYRTFAYPGSNWQKFSLRARAALRLKPEIKYFVVPLDVYQFTPNRAHKTDFDNFLPFSTRDEIKAVYDPSVIELAKQYITSLFPLVSPKNRSTLRNVVGEDFIAFFQHRTNEKMFFFEENHGFKRVEDNVWTELSPDTRNKEMMDVRLDYFDHPFVDEKLFSVFTDFMELSREHGVKVIGVYYPLIPDVRNAIHDFNDTHGDIDRLTSLYKKSGLYATLDYRDIFDDHLEYFHNPDHLNNAGARAFTKILVTDLAHTFQE